MIDLVLLTGPAPHEEVTGGHRYNAEIVARARQNAAVVRLVPIHGSTLPQRVLAARRALREARDADAVIVDSIVAAPVALAGHATPPLVALAHQVPGALGRGLAGAVSDRLARAVYRRCDLVIAVSAWVSMRLRSLPVPRAVVEPGAERPVRAVRRDGDMTRVLSVANWHPHKGILDLVEAISRMPAAAAMVHLVGAPHAETRYGRRVLERLASADVRGRVVVDGVLPVSETGRAFASADVFALPARGEAFGIAFAEALAAGLPVVGYRSGNVPALVGGAGLLVEPGDVEGLARALGLVVLDPDRRDELAAFAHERALGLPTWDETATAFFAALRTGTHFAPTLGRDERQRTASSA